MPTSTEKEQTPLTRALHCLRDVMTYPFKRDFTFFCVVCALSSLVDMVICLSEGEFLRLVYQGLKYYMLVYALTLLSAFLPTVLRRIYKSILFLLCIANAVIDFLCRYTMRIGFSEDVIEVVRGTNKNEIKEFLQIWLDWPVVLFSLSLLLSAYGARRFRKRIDAVGKRVWPLFFIPLLLQVYAMCCKETPFWKGVFVVKIYSFFSYEAPPKPCKKELRVTCAEEGLPEKLVLIIGESFCKSHSSLYGYDKVTNPRLEKLRSDGNLIVYTDVTAAGTHTVAAFENFMTNVATSPEGGEWHECDNLIDLMSGLRYRTIWISNQSPSGIYDNVPASFAALCDTCCFAGNRFVGIGKVHLKGNYDENVLEEFEKIPSDGERRECYVFHLMGSHEVFSCRYPDCFGKFTSEDYPGYAEKRRGVLAEYDNSVLYNDEVVSRILRLFEKEDALALYFSDHALDLFESSDDYYGHARWGDAGSRKAVEYIPCMFYVSPALKERRPGLVRRLEDEKDAPFNMNQLYDKLTDLLDVSVEGG